MLQGVDGVVGYRICLTHRRSPVRTWLDSFFCQWQEIFAQEASWFYTRDVLPRLRDFYKSI